MSLLINMLRVNNEKIQKGRRENCFSVELAVFVWLKDDENRAIVEWPEASAEPVKRLTGFVASSHTS